MGLLPGFVPVLPGWATFWLAVCEGQMRRGKEPAYAARYATSCLAHATITKLREANGERGAGTFR